MSHAKQVSTLQRRTKAVTALGVAGLLSLTNGVAEKVGPAKDTSTENAAAHHEVILEEEEFSDVSLGTFYLFDKENAGTRQPGILPANPEGAEDTDAVAGAAEDADTAAGAVEVAEAARVAVVAGVGVFRSEGSASAVPESLRSPPASQGASSRTHRRAVRVLGPFKSFAIPLLALAGALAAWF
jgi:hypothetical protein